MTSERRDAADEVRVVYEPQERGRPIAFVVYRGRRIAMRYPGGDWIILEPGCEVHAAEPGDDEHWLTVYVPDPLEWSH